MEQTKWYPAEKLRNGTMWESFLQVVNSKWVVMDSIKGARKQDKISFFTFIHIYDKLYKLKLQKELFDDYLLIHNLFHLKIHD